MYRLLEWYYGQSFSFTVSLEEARDFIEIESKVRQRQHDKWKWMIVNPKGFVVVVFDSLRMHGGER